MRKQDVIVAKNYLTADEIDTLNRLVVIFLEQAELRIKQQKELTLDFWRNNIDRMLAFNDQAVLDGAGSATRGRLDFFRHNHSAIKISPLTELLCPQLITPPSIEI